MWNKCANSIKKDAFVIWHCSSGALLLKMQSLKQKIDVNSSATPSKMHTTAWQFKAKNPQVHHPTGTFYEIECLTWRTAKTVNYWERRSNKLHSIVETQTRSMIVETARYCAQLETESSCLSGRPRIDEERNSTSFWLTCSRPLTTAHRRVTKDCKVITATSRQRWAVSLWEMDGQPTCFVL